MLRFGLLTVSVVLAACGGKTAHAPEDRDPNASSNGTASTGGTTAGDVVDEPQQQDVEDEPLGIGGVGGGEIDCSPKSTVIGWDSMFQAMGTPREIFAQVYGTYDHFLEYHDSDHAEMTGLVDDSPAVTIVVEPQGDAVVREESGGCPARWALVAPSKATIQSADGVLDEVYYEDLVYDVISPRFTLTTELDSLNGSLVVEPMVADWQTVSGMTLSGASGLTFGLGGHFEDGARGSTLISLDKSMAFGFTPLD